MRRIPDVPRDPPSDPPSDPRTDAPIDADRIAVRDLAEEDVESIVSYWHDSDPAFLEGMGVDLAKLPGREALRTRLLGRVRENALLPRSQLECLIVTCDGQPIGFHVLNEVVPGDSGIFHAHLWDARFRRRKVARRSYPLACSIFLERFDLRRILFKTPAQNTGPLRVKDQLGIRRIGEESVGFGVIKDGTRAVVFELTREEARTKWGELAFGSPDS